MRFLVPVAAILLAGCPSPGGDRVPAAADTTNRSAATDSLVLTLGDGAQVWLTSGMADTAESGEACFERTMEIRRGEQVRPVPLLYTLETPRIENDSTFRAILARDCVAADTYLVHTGTGFPRKAP